MPCLSKKWFVLMCSKKYLLDFFFLTDLSKSLFKLKSLLVNGKIDNEWKSPDAGKIDGRRRRDGWMASSTQWTWVWANLRSYWRAGKPGVLQSMGSQRVWHDWATEQQVSTLTNWWLILKSFLSQGEIDFLKENSYKLFFKYKSRYLLTHVLHLFHPEDKAF